MGERRRRKGACASTGLCMVEMHVHTTRKMWSSSTCTGADFVSSFCHESCRGVGCASSAFIAEHIKIHPYVTRIIKYIRGLEQAARRTSALCLATHRRCHQRRRGKENGEQNMPGALPALKAISSALAPPVLLLPPWSSSAEPPGA